MLNYIIIVLCVWLLIVIILFSYEIKNALEVNEKDIEVTGDNSATEVFKKTFCKHCYKHLDGFCNNGVHFGKINNEMIALCKKDNFFKPE